MTGYDILYVEDSAADVALMRAAFAQGNADIRLHVVGNGQLAWDFLNRRGRFGSSPRPDLILIDLNLPIMDGTQVVSAIGKDGDLHDIPTIVLTASGRAEDINHSYASGAYLYLLKPNSWERYVGLCEGLSRLLGANLSARPV